MVVTDLLAQDVPIEDVQYLAGHSDPSTTQVYDRRAKAITRNIVERIRTLTRGHHQRCSLIDILMLSL